TWVAGPLGIAVRRNDQRYAWEGVRAGVTAAAALPASATVGPLKYYGQTLNNCGPAALASILEYWGVPQTQAQASALLGGDGGRGGMVAFGIPAFARANGLASVMGVAGSEGLIRGLVAAGFPVMVDQWVSVDDHTDHYRTIEGYDDARQVYLSNDPLKGL